MNREMFDRAERIEDLAERQRFLQDLQARTGRLQTLSLQESQESLRLSQVRLRVTHYGIGVMLVALIPIAMAGARQKRRRRWLESGHCGHCGYDLRESPERCPECGSDTPARAATTND